VVAGWDQDGVVHDGIGYGLLREDWEQGKNHPGRPGRRVADRPATAPPGRARPGGGGRPGGR
jgi:hypothetical protein